MKVSSFDRTTGKFRWYGSAKGKKYQDEQQSGHMIVNDVQGSGPNWKKYDYTLGEVVEDADRKQKDVDRKQKKIDDRNRVEQIKLLLEANYGNRSKDNETIDLLNELARVV